MPEREEDDFWHGDETFFAEELESSMLEEIERCEKGLYSWWEGKTIF